MTTYFMLRAGLAWSKNTQWTDEIFQTHESWLVNCSEEQVLAEIKKDPAAVYRIWDPPEKLRKVSEAFWCL